MDAISIICNFVTRRIFLLKVNSYKKTKIGELLSGENLAETLKSAKAIIKSEIDLKQPSRCSPNKKLAPNTSNSSKYLNWKNVGPFRKLTGPRRPSFSPNSRSIQSGDRASIVAKYVNTAGTLSLFCEQWSKIINDPIVLSYVKGYKIHFLIAPDAIVTLIFENILTVDILDSYLRILFTNLMFKYGSFRVLKLRVLRARGYLSTIYMTYEVLKICKKSRGFLGLSYY